MYIILKIITSENGYFIGWAKNMGYIYSAIYAKQWNSVNTYSQTSVYIISPLVGDAKRKKILK